MHPDHGEWQGEISKPNYDVTVERDVYVEMRDGTKLATNIFRPDTEEPVPALLGMAGYGKEHQDLDQPPQPLDDSALWDGTIEAGDPQEIVSRGYAQVVADVRGTGYSEGTFTGMLASKEGEDGHDLVEWIADQPWCTGRVGMAGYSYYTWCSLKTAIEDPPHLEAIWVDHALYDFYRDTAYSGGVPNLFYYGLWDGRLGTSGFAANNPQSLMERDLPEDELKERIEERLDDPDIGTRPNLYHLLHYPFKNPQFFDMLLNPYDNEHWRERSIAPFVDEIQVPVYVAGKSPHGVTGFWDLYRELTAPKKLLVKPPGSEERPWREDLPQVIRWFDHWLKGRDTGIMDEPPIDLFVQGEESWRQLEQWPLPDVELVECYLNRRGRLSLTPERYQDEPDVFVQPPLHVSSERHSVKYRSAPAPDRLPLLGPCSLSFYAALDQDDTTWIVSLSDIGPSGAERRLAKSYLKASHRAIDEERSAPGRPYHRHTEAASTPIEPGEIAQYDVGLGPLNVVLGKGHRLQLEIRNMESPRDEEMAVHFHPRVTSGRTTKHEIYRNDEHRSHLLLPTVEADEEVLALLGDDRYQ